MRGKGIVIFITCLLLSACTKQDTKLFSQPTGQVLEETVIPSPVTQSPEPTAQSPKPTTLSIISLPSTYKSDEKRALSSIDTIVIHSVYNPDAKDPFTISSIKAVFDRYEVSSHFVITRDGKIYQLVPEDYQAWHAGESKMPAPDNREKVNLFSIGIELVGNETSGFTGEQYESLRSLIAREKKLLPIKHIVGHSDIAPARKTDPWKFEWKRIADTML